MTEASKDEERPEGEAYCPTCDRSFASELKLCPTDGTRLVDLTRPADPMIGRIIEGRFTVRERLGAGGMGVVYRAWQASVGREVAIKVISPRPGDDQSTAKRFLREAKLASQLSQPNIVMVIDFGATDDGMLYLAMELLRGRTLSQVYRKDGGFSVARMLRVATQLCDALESAHKAGIIHRDLKPANVMILDEPAGRDFVKVLDFGLAKALDGEHESTLTQSDRVVGTPSYMAPEIIQGLSAEPRSDLYSVGVMLFEMLCKRLPFAAPNANVMLAKHAYAPVPELEPEIPPQVAHVVKRLLAKRPDQRYATVGELRTALEAAAAGTLLIESASDQVTLETREDSVTSQRELAALALTSTNAAPIRPGTAPATGSTAATTPGPSTFVSTTTSRRRWVLVLLAVALAGAAGAAVAAMSGKDDAAAPPARGGAAPDPVVDAAPAIVPFDAAPVEVVEPAIEVPDAAPPEPASDDRRRRGRRHRPAKRDDPPPREDPPRDPPIDAAAPPPRKSDPESPFIKAE